jgi:hypothetical protein
MENGDAFSENRFPEPTEKEAEFNAPSDPLNSGQKSGRQEICRRNGIAKQNKVAGCSSREISARRPISKCDLAPEKSSL